MACPLLAWRRAGVVALSGFHRRGREDLYYFHPTSCQKDSHGRSQPLRRSWPAPALSRATEFSQATAEAGLQPVQAAWTKIGAAAHSSLNLCQRGRSRSGGEVCRSRVEPSGRPLVHENINIRRASIDRPTTQCQIARSRRLYF